VKKLFDLPQDFLTKRDAWAGTFESVVQTRTEPRTDCPGKRYPTPVRSGRHLCVRVFSFLLTISIICRATSDADDDQADRGQRGGQAERVPAGARPARVGAQR
jgi:hypothetical protein